MDASAYFKDKKITVMGLGLLGRGAGDARYLASCGADLIITDLKSAEELAPSLAELKGLIAEDRLHLGGHRVEDFQGRDLILKAAGIPLDSPFIAEARKEGTPIRMSADLFAELSGIPIVGVTGTRGKTTTTYLIKEILENAGKKVLLGGNIRGVSTLSLLGKVQGDEIAVLELDSWQLQGFGEAKISPHIAVFTTFMPDHLNYYGGDMNAYLEDKAAIFLNQKESDTLVLGAQCAEPILKTYEGKIKARTVTVRDLPLDWIVGIPGEHNRANAACALEAGRALGVEDSIAQSVFAHAAPVSGRLELLKDSRGVRIFNDNNATTPEATIAALRALDPEKKKHIVLIAGGADKQLRVEELAFEIGAHAKRVILLTGTGTDRLLPLVPDASVYDSLAGAFEEAMRYATADDIVLFSPAFASFGMFKNEYDRGDHFVALVNALPA